MKIFDTLKDIVENGMKEIEERKISLEEQKKQEQLQIEQFTRGENLPVIQMPNNVSIVLQKSEVCHCFCLANRNELKLETIGHTARYSGVSFKLAKGIALHNGGAKSKSIKENVMYSYKGIIYITNKRVVFIDLQQNNKNFNIPYNKLLSTVKYIDGVTFQLEKNSYSVTMEFAQGFNAILSGAIKLYNQ